MTDLSVFFNQLVTIESRLNALIEFQLKDNPEYAETFNSAVQEQRSIVLGQYKDQHPEVVQLPNSGKK